MNTLKINQNEVIEGNTFIALVCQAFNCEPLDIHHDSSAKIRGMVKVKGVWFDYFKDGYEYEFIASK